MDMRLRNFSIMPIAFALVIAIYALATNVYAAQPCTSSCRDTITLSNGWKVFYWSNYPLTTNNSTVERAIVVIHGLDRNADDYFGYIVSPAQQEGELERTIIIAPRFPNNTDTVLEGYLYWRSYFWRYGDRSVNGGGISSFDVMDDIARRLGNQDVFPNLREVVLTGHSSGGWFSSRWASGSAVPDSLSHLAFHFIPANSGSYLYFNGYWPRLDNSAMDSFYIPNTSCAYNNYPYGLNNKNNYMSRTSNATLSSRYRERRVTYLLGDADTQRTQGFDASCAADFQGWNRILRGKWFFNYMEAFFPTDNHDLVIVPGVAHSGRDMYNSAAGRQLLFRD